MLSREFRSGSGGSSSIYCLKLERLEEFAFELTHRYAQKVAMSLEASDKSQHAPTNPKIFGSTENSILKQFKRISESPGNQTALRKLVVYSNDEKNHWTAENK
jgi:hypothetical protein